MDGRHAEKNLGCGLQAKEKVKTKVPRSFIQAPPEQATTSACQGFVPLPAPDLRFMNGELGAVRRHLVGLSEQSAVHRVECAHAAEDILPEGEARGTQGVAGSGPELLAGSVRSSTPVMVG